MKRTKTLIWSIVTLIIVGALAAGGVWAYRNWPDIKAWITDITGPVKPDIKTERTVILESEDENKGTVGKLDAEKYKKDTIVKLEAFPKDGYTFSGFYDGETLLNQLTPYSYTVSKDVKIIARFFKATVVTEEKRIYADFEISQNTIKKYIGSAEVVNIPASYSIETEPATDTATNFNNLLKQSSSWTGEVTITDASGNKIFSGQASSLNFSSGDAMEKFISATYPLTINYSKEIAIEGNDILIKNIGVEAFAANQNVKEIVVPEGIEYYYDRVFSNCPNLEKVNIPSSIKLIYAGNFKRCPKLLVTTNNSTYISENGTIYNKDKTWVLAVNPLATSYVFPASVDSLPEFNNNYIENIECQATQVQTFLEAYNCPNLKNIKINYVHTKEFLDHFSNLPALETFTVTVAQDWTEADLQAATGSSVRLITPTSEIDYDFSAIPEDAFFNIYEDGTAQLCRYGNFFPVETLVIPKSFSINILSEETYTLTDNDNPEFGELDPNSKFTLVATGQNGDELFRGGNFQAFDQTRLHWELPVTLNITYYELIPGTGYTVTSIGNDPYGLFEVEGCDEVKKIIIPNTITQIGTGCFRHLQALEEVVFETGNARLEQIGDESFADNLNLKTVHLPRYVGSIGLNVFSTYDEGQLTDIYFDDPYTWGMSETTIADNAFSLQGTVKHEIVVHVPANLVAAFQASAWNIFQIVGY